MATKSRIHFNEDMQANSHSISVAAHKKFVETLERSEVMKELGLRDAKEFDNWLADNRDEFDRRVKTYNDATAIARFNDIENVITNAKNSVMLLNTFEPETKSRFQAPKNVIETHNRLNHDFYDYVRNVAKNGLVDHQTGTDLIKNTIDLNGSMMYQYTPKGVSIPANQLTAAAENIWAKGKFMAYDLETLGGVDHTGQQVLDAITEFSFGEADAATGNMGQYYGSIIGITPQQHKEFTDVIHRYESGAEMSGRDQVILKRLAKTGHANTSYKSTGAGLFEYTSFADDIDIKSMNTKDMRAGADQLLDIFNQQRKTMVTHNGQQMYAWEKRFIEGLQAVKGGDLTLVGHNSGSFDMPMLNRFMQSGRLSQGARSALSALGLETLDFADRHFDTLAAIRTGQGNDWIEMLSDADRQMMKEHGLTHNTLEALTRKFVPDYYEGKVAHVGKTDIGATAAMLVRSGMFKPGSSNYVLEGYGSEAQALVGGNNMLFYAQEGVSQDRNRVGALSFVEDAMTGETRTFGGIRVGAEGAERELFGQYGFQKGVSYTLDSIYEHEMTDEWGNVIRETHPGLDSKRIVTATFRPASNSSSFKNDSPITLVGTRAEVQQQINQHLLLTGTKVDDKWTKTASQQVEDLMGEIEYDPAEGYINPRKHGFTIEGQLQESTLRIENEAASRARREGNIKKEMGLLNFFEDMDAYVKSSVAADAPEAEREAARKKFHMIAREKSLRVARGVTGNKLDEAGADMIKSYHEYFGWKDKKTKEWKVYRETVDAALNSENYALSVRRTMGQLVDAAKTRGGTDEALQAFYFNQYYTGLQAHAAAKMGGIDAVTNTQALRVRGVDKNKFDIDLSGYVDKAGIAGPSNFEDTSHVMTVNLERGNMGLADRLLKARGYRGEASEVDKIKEIKNLTEHLIKTGVIDRSHGSIDMDKHTLETATQHMLGGLRSARKAAPMAGRILAPKFQNVTIASMADNFGLSADEVTGFIHKMDQTMPVVQEMSPNFINSKADDIVKNVLFHHVDEAMLQRDGYSLEQAQDFMRMRKVRMKDTHAFMSDFLHGLSRTGHSILYDEDNRSLHLVGPNGGTQTKLNNLPYDVYENGRFYTKIGNMKVVSPVGVYSKPYSDNLEFKSLIGKAHSNVGWMESAFQRGVDEGDVAGQVDNIIGAFAKTLRGSSSVMNGDMQDAKANGYFAMGDVIPELQGLYKKGVFDGVTFQHHNKVIDFLKGKRTYTVDKLSYEPRTLIALNAKTILQAIASGSGNGDFKYFADQFSFDNKNPTQFVGTVSLVENFGDPYSASKRGHMHQVSRARRFSTEEIRNKALSGISVGRSIHTSSELAQAKMRINGLSFATESAIRVTRLAIDTGDFRTLTNAAHGKNSEYIETMLGGIHLDEGSAVASPELLDSVFSDRASTQKIMLHKITEHNNNVIEELKTKRNLAPQLHIDKDGKITFSYSNGVFVHRGEDLISVNGYKGSTSKIAAKEKGMFRFGAFVDGILATEESIQDTLNSKKNQARIAKAADPIQEALSILNKTYDLGYYVDAFDANPHRKLAESGVEKNMTHFLVGGLGTSDPKVAKTLEALGMKDMLFEVPKKEYIDSLRSDNIANTAFGALVSKQQNRIMTHGEIADIIKSNYGSVQDFQKALQAERNAPMEAVKKILVENELLGENESVHFISDNFRAEKKHKDASAAIRRVVDQLMDNYNDDAEKVKEVLGGAIEGLEVKDGNLVAPNDNIYIDKLEEVIKKEKLNTSRKSTSGIKADLAQTTIVAMEDHDRANWLARGDKYGKGMKFTDRNLQMLEWERYGKAGLARVRDALDDQTFNRAFGHVLEADGKTIKKEYRNRAITKSIGDQIRRAMYNTPGDELLMSNGHVDANVRKRLISDGVDVDQMLSSIEEKQIANVSAKAVEDHYSVATGVLARDWNSGHGHNSIDTMTKKAGFEFETLNRLVSSSGGNKDVAHQLYGRKIMLDLHMDELGKNQLYSSQADRYIALPYEPKSWIDQQRTQEARTPFQQQVASLQNEIKTYISGKDGGVTQKKQAEQLDSMKALVQGIKESISVSVTAKKGGLATLAEAHLDDAGLFKAHGIRFYGNETASYYKALEFDGKNLVKEAAKGAEGAEYDATFVSREFINNIYNKKYLDDLGIGEDELVSHIKKKGTLSINVREPADYKKSASISGMYLSDAVTGNMALSTAVQFESKHGDYDGDSMGIKVLKGQAYIKDKEGNKVLRDIDYASYQILKGRRSYVELTKETDQLFADAVASMHYNAADYNKMYREKAESIERNSLALTAAEEYATNKVLRPINKKYTYEQRVRLESMGKEVMDGLKDDNITNINDLRAAAASRVKSMFSDAKEQNEYMEAVHYEISKRFIEIDNVAKQGRAAAGEVNHYLYQHRRLVDIVSDQADDILSPDERGAIQKVSQAIQEGFLSPKNETSIDTTMLETFKTAMGDMMGFNGEADGSNMKKFLKDALKERKEMERLPKLADGKMMSAEAAIDVFSSFGSKVKLSGVERAYFAQGILKDGINTDKALIRTGRDVDGIDRSLGIVDRFFGLIGVESPITKANIGEAEEQLIAHSRANNAARALNKQESEGMMTLVDIARQKMASHNLNGMSLAKGAVGLAGAVMLAGFVGGNPSRPAETHAQDDSDDDYAIPQLTDTNLNKARGGPQQGYVININAQTDKGQQHASSAIQQAINSGFNNTNVNVSMNIRNSGQAGMADIHKMLATAFS